MEYIIIGGIIVVGVIAAVMFVHKKKKISACEEPSLQVDKSNHCENLVNVENQPQDLKIQMEMLPAEALPDESKMAEITNSKVLAHVNNLVPGLAQVGNAINNAAQAVQANGEVLYRAIIPAGAKLADSQSMKGAVRGIYHGGDGIRGHANLVEVKATKGGAVIANATSAAMGVASMVVGQYYMTQINAELGIISDSISKVADFQDNEYKSRVFSLVAHVKKIADFQVEILENDELRLCKISQLDNLEEECTKLLGQANLTLMGFTKKTGLDYEAYEKALVEAQKWFMYQKSLVDVLYKISDLRYTLYLGKVSREQCTALLPTYSKQVANTQENLNRWHQEAKKRLGIDTYEIRRKRQGIDYFVYLIPGLFNDDFNFRSINKKTAKMINAQVYGHKDIHKPDESNLYAQDVHLIAKDGKVYYLPMEEEG